MTTVLVLTTEPLPLPGCATTGAGLRAWGLAQGLRFSGLEVVIGTPVPSQPLPAEARNCDYVRYFEREAIGSLVEQVAPDVVVLQHWGLAARVPELTVPLAIDLAGPHLLERLYWGTKDPRGDLQEKLEALRRADFVVCSGQYQRHYFYGYLAMAGYDLRTTAFPAIPFSVPPPLDANLHMTRSDREPTFIYGGAFLAWQDPAFPIQWLLEEMDRLGKGRLLFYGGHHPAFDASGGRFEELAKRLSQHPRVEMRGWKPFEQLLEEYRTEGSVALDLMARNPERELAFTTRTMVYLYCGLPVIYNNYSEISNIIEANDCGWTLSPDDEAGFRQLVVSILAGTAGRTAKSRNALQTSASYSWNDTITPLAEFCRAPSSRENKDQSAGPLQDSHAGEHERRRLANPGRLLAPLIYLLTWPVAFYMEYRLRGADRGKSHG